MIGAGQKNLSAYPKNSSKIFKTMPPPNCLPQSNEKNMGFIHVHTKFQLSSFIRSGDIADLLLDVFFSKMPFFQKNAVFIYKSKLAISLLLIKLESWNLVCICTKYIFFSSSNFIALTLAVWRWHDFENFKGIFKIGAQIFLTCTYHYHDLHDFKYLYANFQALFQKSRVLSSTTWTKRGFTLLHEFPLCAVFHCQRFRSKKIKNDNDEKSRRFFARFLC